MRHIWRRFRPRGEAKVVTAPAEAGGDVYAQAHDVIDQQGIGRARLWRRADPRAFDEVIETLRARAGASGEAADWLAALVIQAPRAIAAQRAMDKHPHGYHNKQARLYELIDFNDTYVSLILALPASAYEGCNERIKLLMDRFCRYVKSPCFSNEQWEAITHGLARELSVYRGVICLGYRARLTSRREDAMGVDMVVTDDVGQSINLDIKTRSSFHFRLEELHREGRISELEREAGEKFGHLTVDNGHGEQRVTTTLLRIDEETYGRTIDFALERLEPLGTAIKDIFLQQNSLTE